MSENGWIEYLSRKPALPLRKAVTSLSGSIALPCRIGRVWLSGYYDPLGNLNPLALSQMDENDIAYIPLYRGFSHAAGRGVRDRLSSYRENADLIRDLSSKTRGIVLGNAGYELGFKSMLWDRPNLDRRIIAERMAEFVYATSAFVEPYGGVPVYIPFDWDVCIDYYYGNGVFAQAVREVHGEIIILNGITLARGEIPHSKGDPAFCPYGERDEKRPELRGYISLLNCASGIPSEEDVRDRMDEELKDYGFVSGIVRGYGWKNEE